MNSYKEKDVVVLETALQKMTVAGYNSNNEVICFWLDDSRQFQSATFPENLLKLVPTAEPPNFEYLNLAYAFNSSRH